MPFAPVHDHEGRSQIPRPLTRFRGGVRGTRFRARRTPRNCWLPPAHNSSAVFQRIPAHLGEKPGFIFLAVQDDFTSASAPLSFLILRSIVLLSATETLLLKPPRVLITFSISRAMGLRFTCNFFFGITASIRGFPECRSGQWVRSSITRFRDRERRV